MAAQMDARGATERFFSAFYLGDLEATRQAVIEDVTLEGPFAAALNIAELLQLAEGLMKIARGHKVVRWKVDGDQCLGFIPDRIAGPAGEGVVDDRRLVHCG
jgi:hypothetical protein